MMQLQSLFNFFGRTSISSENDVDANAGSLRSSTGFGAMLASTLGLRAKEGSLPPADESARASVPPGSGENTGSETSTRSAGQGEGDARPMRAADTIAESDDLVPAVGDADEPPNDAADEALRISPAGPLEAAHPGSGRHHDGPPVEGSSTDADPTEKGHKEAGAGAKVRTDSTRAATQRSDAVHAAAQRTDAGHVTSGRATGTSETRESQNGARQIGRNTHSLSESDTLRMHSDLSPDHSGNASDDGEMVHRGSTRSSASATTDDVDLTPATITDTAPAKSGGDSDAEPTHSSGTARAGRGDGLATAEFERPTAASGSASEVDDKPAAADDTKSGSIGNKIRSDAHTAADTSRHFAEDTSSTRARTDRPTTGVTSGERRLENETERSSQFAEERSASTTGKGRSVSELNEGSRASSPGHGRSVTVTGEGHIRSTPQDGRVSEPHGGRSPSPADEMKGPVTQSDRVAGDSPKDAVRAAELERSSRRLFTDRIRITRETPASDSSTDAADEAHRSKLDAARRIARVEGNTDATEGAASGRRSGAATRASTGAPNAASPNATSGTPANLLTNAAVDPNQAEPTKPAGAELSGEPSADSTERGPHGSATPKSAGADDRTGRDARAEADRANSRASSADRAASGDASNGSADQNSGGGQQRNFASGTDASPADAFDLAAAERSGDAVEFDSILHEDVSTDAEIPIDIELLDSADETTFSPEKAKSTNPTSHVNESRRLSQPRQSGIVNWVRAKVEDSLRAISIDEGWKVLEMKLDEGQGTMTVRARRDEEKISITVNFTDPQLRALAAENVDRLQESLRSQYQADVDFSLMGDNADQSQHQSSDAPHRGGRPSEMTPPSSQSVSGADRARAARAAHSGARNEWIG